MELAPIVARLESQLSGFKKIGGAADLEAIGNGVVPTPSCYVVMTRETARDIDLVGGYEQAITVGFGVVIAVANRFDATGGAAIDVLDALRKQIKARKQAGADESQVQELYFRSVEIEDRIRERLSVELRKYHEALQQALDRMGWLDVVIAKAMQARDWGLTRPAITQDTTSFRGLFNPELRISLEAAGKRFQPVNIRLTTGPTVITGANMSGKTVLLHSVELAQYMLQFGFYIAAERAEIALVDEVHCSIGDGQDQLSGLSSFAAEMMRMDELAKSVRAGRRVLALIDEPARTTNPVEGRAIVNGVLEFLADYEVPSLVTTHYNGIAAPCRKLKVKGFSETNAEERITLKNINDFIDYSLEEVTTDEVPHEAIRIARILGIDPEILRRIERNEELKNNQ
mgnify:CR=1 FL=1